MNLTQNNTNKKILILSGAFLGCFLFLFTYGTAPLDVTNTAWLPSGDTGQHYLGWVFFRDTPWSFPLGSIQGLTDENLSVIYTDSIPLFALFFKLLSPILPEHFQYFGIWGIMSFSLMGAFSVLLLWRFTNNAYVCILGSTVFTLSPYVLQRMFAHTSLAGQWIIILALLIWVYNFGQENYRKKVAGWVGTIVLATLIHPYFIVYIMVLLLADTVRYLLDTKKIGKSIFLFMIPPIVSICTLAVMGAFSEKSTFTDTGFGYYTMNLNSLLNASYFNCKIGNTLASLNISIPVYDPMQWEGCGYLGAGIILLLFIDLIIVLVHTTPVYQFIKEHKTEILLTLLIIAAFVILGLSPTITAGKKVLFTIPWPEFIMKILQIFRASGRFVWAICYILFAVAIIIPIKFVPSKITASILITVCIMLQGWDISPKLQEVKSRFLPVETNLVYDSWIDLLSSHNKVVYLPYDRVRGDHTVPYELVYIATENDLDTSFSSFNTARMNLEKMQANEDAYIQEIVNDTAPASNLYIVSVSPEIDIVKNHLYMYRIDGIVVGCMEPLAEKYQNNAIASIHTTMGLPTDAPIYFSGPEWNADTYVYGISVSESEFTWTDGTQMHFTKFITEPHEKFSMNLSVKHIFNGPQRIIVDANGVITEITADQPGVISIPVQANELGELIIDIQLPDAISPKAAGASVDERVLALALTQISFTTQQ